MSLFSDHINWVNSRIQRMRYLDIAALKVGVMLFTLFLVKIWPPLDDLSWRWYLGLSFLVVLPFIFRVFERQWVQAAYVGIWVAIYLAVELLTTF